MVKISGLENFSKSLDDAQKALSSLDGDIGSVQFKPDDPASIEAAIQQVEAMIDERVLGYADNPFIAPLVEAMKDSYRAALLDRATEARLEGDTSDHEGE